VIGLASLCVSDADSYQHHVWAKPLLRSVKLWLCQQGSHVMTARPSPITENATLRRHDAAQPQGETETVRQAVASSPTGQPLDRVGGVSWSTQVLNYLQSNLGLVRRNN
jgi:hypothetical protein